MDDKAGAVVKNNDTTPNNDSGDGNNIMNMSPPWPEEGHEHQSVLKRIINHLFYSYMSDIFSKGAQLHRQRRDREMGRRGRASSGEESESSFSPSSSSSSLSAHHEELSDDDLFQAPKTMHSDHLIEKFHSIFTKMKVEMDRERAIKSQSDEHINEHDIIRKKRQMKLHSKERRWMFMKTLWLLSKPTYIPAGIYQLITVLVQALSPIIVQNLLRLFEQNPNTSLLSFSNSGILYAIALFLCSIIDGVAQEKHKYQAYQSGIVVRAATGEHNYEYKLCETCHHL